METTIQPFTFQGNDVRTITIDGEPWFVATDIARILGYRDAANMTRRLDDEDKGTHSASTPRGNQTVTVISEAGLYAAILGSQVEGARAFKRWVTHEVLPTIRKTGGYQADVPKTYAEALALAAAQAKDLEEAQAQAAIDAPKVEYVDRFVSPDDVVTVRVAAQELGLKESALRAALLEAGWIYRIHLGKRYSETRGRLEDVWEYRATAKHVDKFSLRPQHNAPRHHNGQVRQTLYVRSNAMTALRRRFALTLIPGELSAV